jgi:hypothetical protein
MGLVLDKKIETRHHVLAEDKLDNTGARLECRQTDNQCYM